jgi:hypothetical protein
MSPRLLEPFHSILFSYLCEQKEQNETTGFDHRHHEAGFLQTQNGKQEDAPEESPEKASEEIRSIEQSGCLT